MSLGQLAQVLSGLDESQWISLLSSTEEYLNETYIWDKQIVPKLNDNLDYQNDKDSFIELIETIFPIIKRAFRDAHSYRYLPAEFRELFETKTEYMFHLGRKLLEASNSTQKIEFINDILSDKMHYLDKEICNHCECVTIMKNLKIIIES
ncbi:hypothetical protein GF319_09210 [Candidatus Bathyarchaeota archaeon]|nr:hypothetical protein [Candidatus Bathyarchaeota archaeon]